MITLHALLWLISLPLLAIIVSSEHSSNVETIATGEERCSAETCASALDSSSTPHNFEGEECGVWLALSTLPGTGIGMFAGKEFKKDQEFMAIGDHIIPIVDFTVYQNETVSFLWDEYIWVRFSLCWVEECASTNGLIHWYLVC